MQSHFCLFFLFFLAFGVRLKKKVTKTKLIAHVFFYKFYGLRSYIYIFLKILFIFDIEREFTSRGRSRQREREKQVPR